MKRRILLFLSVALLPLSLGGASCARIFPPAGPPVGPKPTPVAQPPSAPHGSTGQEDCLACHSTDEGFIASLQVYHPVPVPPGFTGSTMEACQLCHAVGEGHTAARLVSHRLEGMEACLACHSSGMAGFPQTPANHSGYAIEKCTGCHAQPRLSPEPPTPGMAPSTPTPVKAASAIPHGVDDMDDCLACHGAGQAGLPSTPLDHLGRTNKACRLCHPRP